MKGISLVLGSTLMLASLAGFATTDTMNTGTTNTTTTTANTTTPKHTDMRHNWTCSTNATSSDKQKDKDADKKMATAASLNKNMKEAAQHCRDCTKITCEATQ